MTTIARWTADTVQPNTVHLQAANWFAEGYEELVLGDQPVAYWPLNDPVNSTYAPDRSGHGYTGTYSSGAIAGATPTRLVGNTAACGYFAGNDDVATSLFTPYDNLTVELWFNFTSFGSGDNPRLIANGHTDTDNNGFQILTGSINAGPSGVNSSPGQVLYGVVGNGTTRAYVYQNIPINLNTWYHLVMVYQGGTLLTLYVNGAYANQVALTFQQLNANHGVALGYNPSYQGDYFNGYLAHVAIYNVALTSEAIQRHYNAGLSAKLALLPDGTWLTTGLQENGYVPQVLADQPLGFWELATTADNSGYNDTLTAFNSPLLNQVGPSPHRGVTSVLLNGNNQWLASNTAYVNPQVFSLECWMRTRAAQGLLMGFGNSNSSASSYYDRDLYLDSTGYPTFFVGSSYLTSSVAVNDGAWHHVVLTQGSVGVTLYVDGAVVGTLGPTDAQSYTGYWRLGWDNLTGVQGQPTSMYLAGYLAYPALYNYVLTPTQVQQHHLTMGNFNGMDSAGGLHTQGTLVEGNYNSLVLADRPLSFYNTGWYDFTGNSYDVAYGNGAAVGWNVGANNNQEAFPLASGSWVGITGLPTQLPTPALSVELWWQAYDLSAVNPLLSEGNNYELLLANGVITFKSVNQGFSQTGGNATAGAWYHTVWTYDNVLARLYVNGVLTSTLTLPNLSWHADSYVVALGAELVTYNAAAFTVTAGSSHYTVGYAGPFALYNYALTPTQVQQHYLTGQSL